jgi:lycopene beta-cyclase
MASTHHCDVAIVGAGLAGGLLALALRASHPDLDVRLIDAAPVVGGHHRWSFFGSDVAPEHRSLLSPLVVDAWPAYDVAFPAHARTIAEPYYSITSERLDAHVRETLPTQALMLERRVLAVSPRAVVLADGDRVEAAGVIDARGAADLSTLECAWQKFVGRELVLSEPHGIERATIMDATVEQHDGYRFVYTLPTAPDRMFVEDTYYSDTAELDQPAIGERVLVYAQAKGWMVAERAGGEAGVLPIVLAGDFEAYWRSSGVRVAKIGMRAGLFHPTTGYSLPDAVRTAHALAERRDFQGEALHDDTYATARRAWGERGFYRMLDRMLFRAAEPAERYRVLERFYRLSPGLIGRFYASGSTMMDKARVLSGKPPVPFWRGVRAVMPL